MYDVPWGMVSLKILCTGAIVEDHVGDHVWRVRGKGVHIDFLFFNILFIRYTHVDFLLLDSLFICYSYTINFLFLPHRGLILHYIF